MELPHRGVIQGMMMSESSWLNQVGVNDDTSMMYQSSWLNQVGVNDDTSQSTWTIK